MARRKKPTVHLDDATKIQEWLKKNKVKRIPANPGGVNVVKSFFTRRPKKKTKAKETKTA